MRTLDRKAPRFRETSMSLVTKETLTSFKVKYPEYKDLDLKTFREIIHAFNRNIVEGIIDNRNGVALPEGLGFIFMGSCEPAKKKNIDYKKSAQYGVEATYRNWDSDNHLLKIFYSNYSSRYPFRYKELWTFKASRLFKTKASKAYKDNWAKYIQVDPTKKITAIFQRHKRNEYMKNLKPDVPEDYNEFKL